MKASNERRIHMSPIRFPEHKHFTPRDDLAEHVAIAALQAVSGQLPGLEDWQRATVRKRPTSIFDINGKLLFLDYPVARGTEVVGKVRGAASRVLGPPVVSLVRENASWDYAKSAEALNTRMRKEYPNWKIRSTKLVCYSYPKLGVMYNVTNPGGKQARLIFDIASLNLIPEATPESRGREGAYAWSFYDMLLDEQRAERLDQYQKIDRRRLEISPDTRQLMVAAQSLVAINELIVGRFPGWATVTRQLQFCNHYLHTEARSHHCFSLHGQQVDDYCALATCQMILDYYRYYYTQDQIAPALDYSHAARGCPSDQSAGYESLSNNHLDATYDSTPSFAEAQTQIDALRPFKSGVPHHARACAGYSYTSFLGNVTSQSLYIYDPWPWNADFKAGGAVYWENWNAVTRTNCVYTRLVY
jgi:hypothetical protein